MSDQPATISELCNALRDTGDPTRRLFLLRNGLETTRELAENDELTVEKKWKEVKESDFLDIMTDMAAWTPDVMETNTALYDISAYAWQHIAAVTRHPDSLSLFVDDDAAIETLKPKLRTILNQLLCQNDLLMGSDPIGTWIKHFPQLHFYALWCQTAYARQDPEMLNTIKREEILEIIYALIFDDKCTLMRVPDGYNPSLSPPIEEFVRSSSYLRRLVGAYSIPVVDGSGLTRCYHILSAYNNLVDNSYSNRAAGSAVRRYGLKNVLHRSISLLADERIAERFTLLACSQLILHLRGSSEYAHHLAGVRPIMLIVDSYWTCVRRGHEPLDESSLLAYGFACDLVTLLQNPPGARPIKGAPHPFSVNEYHHFQEFALLVSCAYRIPRYKALRHLTAQLPVIASYLGSFRRDKPGAVAELNQIVETCMHVLNCFQEFHRSQPLESEGATTLQQAIDGWKGVIAEVAGLERKDQFDQWEMRMFREPDTETDGCSWFKCPLYRNSELGKRNRMMRCTRCKKTQYCSNHCQKSDWIEGGHQSTCIAKPT